MIVDLNLQGKTVLVIGGGREAERKIRNLLDECGTLIIASKTFSDGIRKLVGKKRVRLCRVNAEGAPNLIQRFRPAVLFATTDDRELNASLVLHGRRKGILSYCVDDPSSSDFNMPAITRKGGLVIAFYTGGKSPLVSSILRKRVERLVTKRDLEEIKLQDFMRRVAKREIPDAERRRRALYCIATSPGINSLLDSGKIKDARRAAIGLINGYGEGFPKTRKGGG